MKERFIAKRFEPESMELLAQCVVILERYEAQGYDLSLRQLYYQLVAANIIANNERNYKNVGNLISDARLAGLVDWDMIKDRGRETHISTHWDSPAQIVDAAARGFRIDRWEGQPAHVEVMVEKQALEGVLLPVCRELDVPFSANKGYSSSSALYETGRRLRDAHETSTDDADGREIVVIYLGDHDPSGIDMSRDVKDRLELFSGYRVRLERIALNMDQVEELNPPENPAKLTDSRAASYIAEFGRSSWELDAIEPAALADLVRKAVIRERDEKLWNKALKREAAMRRELELFVKNYGKGKKK